MYEKILLAVDGSVESKLAAQEVNKFIQLGVTKKVEILYVGYEYIGMYDNMLISIDILYNKVQSLGKNIIAEVRAILLEPVEIEEKILIGNPAQVICEEAEKTGSDMIIMGSRGKDPLRGILLGSVSTRVLQFATCPVFIVKKYH